MRLKDVVRAPKVGIELGKWSSGKIPRAQFPLLKAPSRGYRFGPSYEWRIIKFTAQNVECRVLVLLNKAREKYRATLAVARGAGFVPVCDHEFSAPNEPWHCHVAAGNLDHIQEGVRRRHMKRWPKNGSTVHKLFVESKSEATNRALQVFRIEAPGELV